MLRGWSHMPTRWALIGASTITALAAAALVAGIDEDAAPAQAPAATRPNVVLVMTDDQTVEQMGALKHVEQLIGAQGTTFMRNFASFPLCCPSRATYLTGQYPHNHAVLGNKPPAGGFYKLDSSNTLPVWLSDAGYATAHIGKYLNGYGRRDPRQVPAGWQEWRLGRSDDLQLLQLLPQRERDPARLRRGPAGAGMPRRRAPAPALPGGPVHGEGSRLHRPSRAGDAAVLAVGRLPGAARRWTQSAERALQGLGQGRAAPSRILRRRAAAAAAGLQRARRRRQARLHQRAATPDADADRHRQDPLPVPARVAAGRRRGRAARRRRPATRRGAGQPP
jgi:arylsulfatase A-like enzyme